MQGPLYLSDEIFVINILQVMSVYNILDLFRYITHRINTGNSVMMVDFHLTFLGQRPVYGSG